MQEHCVSQILKGGVNINIQKVRKFNFYYPSKKHTTLQARIQLSLSDLESVGITQEKSYVYVIFDKVNKQVIIKEKTHEDKRCRSNK